MDKTHRYTKAQPAGRANRHAAKDGTEIWIARPEDAGDTVEKKQAAPASRGTDRVPQYLPGTPTGSAADVRAKGAWADGWWTLELARKLDTGHADDTPFDPKRAYKMAVSAHDRTGDRGGVCAHDTRRPRQAGAAVSRLRCALRGVPAAARPRRRTDRGWRRFEDVRRSIRPG
jgi:hypothetical protein